MVTGLVFDLPHGRWMDDVLRLRSLNEPVRLQFPIEITVVGSSGLGWFAEGQAKSNLMRRVGEVARGFAPFSFQFDKVVRFPDSGVYYFAPHDASHFHDFQLRLADCELRFEPAAFSYVPHCTIAVLARDPSSEAHAEVLACPVPADDIRVSSVSFWSVDRSKQEARRGECISFGS